MHTLTKYGSIGWVPMCKIGCSHGFRVYLFHLYNPMLILRYIYIFFFKGLGMGAGSIPSFELKLAQGHV